MINLNRSYKYVISLDLLYVVEFDFFSTCSLGFAPLLFTTKCQKKIKCKIDKDELVTLYFGQIS